MTSKLALTTIDYLSRLPPESFLGALLLALGTAAAAAGLYRRVAARTPDAMMPLICLVFASNLACTLAAVGFVQSQVPTVRLVERSGRHRREHTVELYNYVAPPDAPATSGVSPTRLP